jgi:hypothetical protein
LIGGLLSNLAQHAENRTLLYKAELRLQTKVSQQLAALTQVQRNRPRTKDGSSTLMQASKSNSFVATKTFEHVHTEIPPLSSLSLEHMQQLQRECKDTEDTLSATAPLSASKVSRFCHRHTAGRLQKEVSEFFESTGGDRPATTSLHTLSTKQRVALPRLSSAPSSSLSLTKTMGTFFCPYQRNAVASLVSGTAHKERLGNDAAPFATWSPNILSTSNEPLDGVDRRSRTNLQVAVEPSHRLQFNKVPHSSERSLKLQQKEDGTATSFTLAKFKVSRK